MSFPAQVHDPRDAVAQRVVLISALLEQDMRKSRVRISPWVSLYTFLFWLYKTSIASGMTGRTLLAFVCHNGSSPERRRAEQFVR